ncbi:MAG: hypothetical protein IKV16_01620 [Clostridia bacterium]|nr:hypothetical protein [Clostridia bacterium]
MYTRSYLCEDKAPEIPENYDGNAFKYEKTDTRIVENEFFEEKEDRQKNQECESRPKEIRLPSILEKLQIKRLGALFGIEGAGEKSGDHIRIGTEEILIIAIALYMFFSKDGDKECAIMLAILLFIS